MFPVQTVSLSRLSESSLERRLSVEYPSRMARPKTGGDATKNLRDGDKTQDAPKGTKLGLLRKRTIMGDFAKIAKRGK